ncbi:integrin-linked protein kinase 1 isoform X4 [Gossypium raimondii]|uniref:integrin-linked protein kinase 1 isoform X4 n=1 Tax=Gossypium raimondii TaxID=29730 RepID=UPI00227AFAD2|nr:integrin-linked protein kinase 1 isoform X4 [Gossypium raimondii]
MDPTFCPTVVINNGTGSVLISSAFITNPQHCLHRRPMMKKLVFKIGFAIKIEDFRPSHSSSMLVGQKVDSGGLYRLLQCASKGDKAGVIQELDKGVEPNGADYDRRTAFHLAACEGWIEVVDLLLEKGADVNSLDHWGRTPLSDAHSFRHNEVCKILKARGGIDPVGMDSQAPCFEIDHSEVDMEEATRIGEILAHHFGGWL